MTINILCVPLINHVSVVFPYYVVVQKIAPYSTREPVENTTECHPHANLSTRIYFYTAHIYNTAHITTYDKTYFLSAPLYSLFHRRHGEKNYGIWRTRISYYHSSTLI